MQTMPSSCNSCIHRISDNTCDAFPDLIPDQFILDGEPHTTPIPSQKNKIVWEFAPGTELEFEDWKKFQEAGS
jgi:hypothetical protein